MNPARLRDIETAQRIEGCHFTRGFRQILSQVAEGAADVEEAVIREIRAAKDTDRSLELPRVPRWRRMFGTPTYYAPGHRVLRNLPGLTSPVLLNDLTGRLCALRMVAGDRGADVVSDATGLLKLHDALFGDVFAWAGHLRFVNLSSQGIAFAPVPAIDHHLALAVDDLMICRGHQANGIPIPLEPLCRFLAEYLWCHPFRDGNGRTAMALLMSMTSPGALSSVGPDEWYAASAQSLRAPGFPDPEPWVPILRRMLDH
ncbi:Fic family protein [Corynebacterium glyciniphilum]|uniref:Fic family protein n=1 Tax=Corynebacterium glyciniphilum TaxID=1404244 RepID=UPI003FD3EE79